jgi:Flp pilus assembly protein TadD
MQRNHPPGSAGKPPRSPHREERESKQWDAVEEGVGLLEDRQFEAGLLELKKVVESDPNNAYAYNLIGKALWELGKIEPARDAFKASVLLSPNFLGARVALSHAQRRLGEASLAEREARIALTRFPDDGEAYHALGLALAAQGERQEARECLNRFLATKPEFEIATEVRGVLAMLDEGEEGEGLDVEEDD